MCVLQDYYIILDTNLPSHFYRFTRPEASIPGSEDSHITLTFNVQVYNCLYICMLLLCTHCVQMRPAIKCLVSVSYKGNVAVFYISWKCY